ncbi:MAG TPA: YARHG domain-containing protein [Clostridiaceae bacterium]
MNRKVTLLILLLIIISLIGCISNKETVTIKAKIKTDATVSSDANIKDNSPQIDIVSPVIETTINKTPGYIFQSSNKKIISSDELKTCDKFTLLLAKNELFARKGYKFKDSDLLEYFSNKSWYNPVDNVKGNLEELGGVEKQNFNSIDKSYNSFKYSILNDWTTHEKKEYTESVEKDINNDGVTEKISCTFVSSTDNSSDDYTITVNFKGTDYKIQGIEENVNTELFFADFNAADNSTEFYITSQGPSDDPGATIFSFTGDSIKKDMTLAGSIISYDGKGRIYTDFSKTSDINKIVLSYYEIGKGLVYPDKIYTIGKYLQYPLNYKLLKTEQGMSYIYDADGKDYNALSALYNSSDIVKVTNVNEKLKIVDVDCNLMKDIVRNIPIKVEGEDGKTGWLMWLNGGD